MFGVRDGGGHVSYEAFVYHNNKVEKLATGLLEELFPHLPILNDMYAKGSDGSFKLQLPRKLNGATWFTKSIFNRFSLFGCFLGFFFFFWDIFLLYATSMLIIKNHFSLLI